MKAILVLAALLPLSAQAAVIFVDYTGTVYETGGNPDYVLGQVISGRVTIDALSAGPDIDPRSNYGRYGSDWGDHPAVPDFLTSSLICRTGCPSTDVVSVANGFAWVTHPDVDLYQVDDNINRGAGLPRLNISAFVEGIVDDDGLVQSFERSSSDLKGDETMFGIFINKADQFLRFTVDRLSVRPAGRCSI